MSPSSEQVTNLLSVGQKLEREIHDNMKIPRPVNVDSLSYYKQILYKP